MFALAVDFHIFAKLNAIPIHYCIEIFLMININHQ